MALAFLLATQRSGTNFLRDLLGNHPRVAPLAEVFNTEEQAEQLLPLDLPCYWRYHRQQISADPETGHPSHNPDRVAEYFALVDHWSAGRVALLDIKYNSLHHADPDWRYPSEPPRMLWIIRGLGAPLIWMRRRDRVAVVYSLIKTQHTGVYHRTRDQPEQRVTLRIEPAQFLHGLERMEKDDALVEGWLARTRIPTLPVDYEDLFVDAPGSAIDHPTMDAVLRFLGERLDAVELRSNLVRTSSEDFRPELENHEEIEAYLRGTRFHAQFLDHVGEAAPST